MAKKEKVVKEMSGYKDLSPSELKKHMEMEKKMMRKKKSAKKKR